MSGLQEEFRKAAEPEPTPPPRRVTTAAVSDPDPVTAPAFAPPPEDPVVAETRESAGAAV